MLDIAATLVDSSGATLASSNPVDELSAALTANIAAPGTYYLRIDGTGKGDPLGTGYTDYGSIGQYTISGTAQATVGQPPTAAVVAIPVSGNAPLTVNFDASGSWDPDGTIAAYAWNFGDGGSQTGGATAQWTYVAPGAYDATLTVTDNTGLTDSESVRVTVNAPPPATLTVSRTGNGSGSVSSSPPGVNCGVDCVETEFSLRIRHILSQCALQLMFLNLFVRLSAQITPIPHRTSPLKGEDQ